MLMALQKIKYSAVGGKQINATRSGAKEPNGKEQKLGQTVNCSLKPSSSTRSGNFIEQPPGQIVRGDVLIKRAFN